MALGGSKKRDYNKIRVSVYLNKKNFPRYAKLAEKAGKRRVGLLLFVQQKDGFANEQLANTDGLSKFFKFAADYWEENEASRLDAAAEIAREEKELAEKKKRLGIA